MEEKKDTESYVEEWIPKDNPHLEFDVLIPIKYDYTALFHKRYLFCWRRAVFFKLDKKDYYVLNDKFPPLQLVKIKTELYKDYLNEAIWEVFTKSDNIDKDFFVDFYCNPKKYYPDATINDDSRHQEYFLKDVIKYSDFKERITSLQKLEMQLLDDEDFKVGDIVFIAKGTHFLYKELALIDEINDEYYKLYHILKRNTGGYIYRPLNVDFIPKSKKISLSHVSKKLSDEIKQSLEKELSGLENKVYLHNLFGCGLNGLFGTSKTENDNAAQKLLDSIKDTELKDVIKPYFNSLPKIKDDSPYIAFGKNAVFVGVQRMCYKIKYNIPTYLVGKSSHENRPYKTIEDIFINAAKDKKGIPYPPTTFSPSNVKYMFDKYDVLVLPTYYNSYDYVFQIGGEYFSPDYLKRCLKFAGKIYLSSLKFGSILFSQSENIEFILCKTYLPNPIYDTTIVDFINDNVITEYGVKSAIESAFEYGSGLKKPAYGIDAFFKIDIFLLKTRVVFASQVADVKKALDNFVKLNKAYKLLTGKEYIKIPKIDIDLEIEKDETLSLAKFITDDELRPVLACIGYKEGYAMASDACILVAVKDQYVKNREGKTYNILGFETTDSTFPKNAKQVLDSHINSSLNRITIDYDRLEYAIKLAKKLPKEIRGEDTRIVMLSSGVMFRSDLLEKVLYFLKYCTKPQIYLTEHNVLCIRDKDEIHNLILMNRINSDIFVSCVDLKYHLRRKFYGKEGDRITSIVKGNCVTFEDTELHKLELKLFDKD